jgi:type II secretory pathway pseudopilin PulG
MQPKQPLMQVSVTNVKRKLRCSGSFIIEIIIGLAILGVVMSFSLMLTQKNSDKQTGRLDAEILSSFQQMAAQYFVSNRTEMMAAMVAAAASDANVQKHCVVMIPTITATINPGTVSGAAGANGTLAWSSTKKTCSFDASLLQANSQWQGKVSFIDTVMGGQWRYVAIFKIVMTAGPDTVLGTADDIPSENVEMLVVKMDENMSLGTSVTANDWSLDKSRIARSLTTRDTLSESGGVMPIGSVGWCTTNKTTTQICGNNWNIDLSNWIDSAQLAIIRQKLPS